MSKGRSERSAVCSDEGGEEYLEDVIDPFLRRATFDREAQFDFENAVYDFLVGGALGGLGGTVEAVKNVKADALSVAPQKSTGKYTQTPPRNVEMPTVPIISIKRSSYAQEDGTIPENGNHLREHAIRRARNRLTLDTNNAAFIPASNVLRNGEEYVLKITNSTLKKMLSPRDQGRIALESILVMDNLERIANNGVWKKSEGDRKGRQQGFDHLLTTIYIDNEPYIVNFRVRLVQMDAPNKRVDNVLYYFTPEEIVSIKKVDASSPTDKRHALNVSLGDSASTTDNILAPDGNVNGEARIGINPMPEMRGKRGLEFDSMWANKGKPPVTANTGEYSSQGQTSETSAGTASKDSISAAGEKVNGGMETDPERREAEAITQILINDFAEKYRMDAEAKKDRAKKEKAEAEAITQILIDDLAKGYRMEARAKKEKAEAEAITQILINDWAMKLREEAKANGANAVAGTSGGLVYDDDVRGKPNSDTDIETDPLQSILHNEKDKTLQTDEAGITIEKTDELELYRKGVSHRRISRTGQQIIDKPTYNKITKEVIKKGADIRIANNEWLRRLDSMEASAVTIGDVIFFRPDATVSDVLEETYHFLQNKRGLNDRFSAKQRIILNEIEAKEYLLSMTQKYKIPEQEVELTRKQLLSYTKEMENMKIRGEWND